MARQFYLQLYFDVLDDPLVASLPQTWQLAFIKLLTTALKSDEPGILTMSIEALTRAIGWRTNVAKTHLLLASLEDSRLIGYRKADEALMIAPRLLPQLKEDEDRLLPPRRPGKPSDAPERVKERVDRSRGKLQETTPVHPQADALASFFDQPQATESACNAPCNAPVTPPKADHYSKEEESKTTTTDRGVTVSAPEEGKAVVVAFHALRDSLMQEGVTEGVAVDLLRIHGPERCALQLEYWPANKSEKKPTNPGGMLRKAIDENWAPPKSFQDRAAQAQAEAAAQEQRRRERRDRETREAQAAMQETLRLGWWEEQSEEMQAEIEAEARKRMSSNMRERLLLHESKGETPGMITLQALEAARAAVITERMAVAG